MWVSSGDSWGKNFAYAPVVSNKFTEVLQENTDPSQHIDGNKRWKIIYWRIIHVSEKLYIYLK